ncbi:MAG: ABC transporter permease [Paracoccus sp. (in: a-proteobacteria)]|uniref:ABC transporter permease n=1 Tax=Paracoccus sp. TaxID=267 RepID=UPI0026DFAE93|nr:ABC transporter permease [Paracoccus sp. (in: a-proteobacteria)]MDO5614190.1 ABC transporter permease [Paracoccus sp. (in: a-proteobacteria)]
MKPALPQPAAAPAKPELREINSVRRRWPTMRAVGALMLREMSTTYGRSAGGYIWAVLEPVAGITLLVVIFSLALRSPPIGTNFAIFYASGIVPFMFYNHIAASIGDAIRYSQRLLAYPAVTFVDALVARLMLNVITQLLVAYVVLTGIVLTMDTRTDPQIASIALGFAMATVLAAGVGTLNCFLGSAFPTWNKIWAVLNRPMFILACILFPFDSVPVPYRDWLWWNPVVHIVGQVRHGFYPSYSGWYVSPAYVFAFGIVTMTVGLLLLTRYHRDLLNS